MTYPGNSGEASAVLRTEIAPLEMNPEAEWADLFARHDQVNL